MKILMVNDNDPDAVVGGVERYIADVTAALTAAGHRVYWFVLSDPEIPVPESPRKHVFRVPPTRKAIAILRHAAYYREAHRALSDCIARVRPDVVHLHNNYRLPRRHPRCPAREPGRADGSRLLCRVSNRLLHPATFLRRPVGLRGARPRLRDLEATGHRSGADVRAAIPGPARRRPIHRAKPPPRHAP